VNNYLQQESSTDKHGHIWHFNFEEIQKKVQAHESKQFTIAFLKLLEITKRKTHNNNNNNNK
jgi:hypothetical protein